MDDEAHSELHDGLTDESEPEETESPGAFFPNAQHFGVTGGNFTNINCSVLTIPSDFRRLRMGDLDLLAEIYLDGRSSVVYRRGKQASVRRIYSAWVRGVDSKMTVALYQGNNAEEEWQEDIRRHSWLRHPNFVQIYGTASSCGIHAAVFHDDLVPAKSTFDKYRVSHFATVYLWNQLETELTNAYYYLKSYSERELSYWDNTMWIRRSTGRLCIELVMPGYDSNPITYGFRLGWSRPLGTSFLFEPPDHSQIIEAISMDQYHAVCGTYLKYVDTREVSSNTSVHLRGVVYMPAGYEIVGEVVYLSDPQFVGSGWHTGDSPSPESCQVLESGWTRVIPSAIPHKVILRHIFGSYDEAWLAQANHIFDCASIPSKYSDYGLIAQVNYRLSLSYENDIPHGYLFLCPLKDLQGNSPSEFRHLARPAYWSLDPSGAQRLGSEEAETLGFPSFTLSMSVSLWSWDDLVYAGIREYHQAKGFDPYSQDVARELGYPLYKVCGHETEVFDDDEVPNGAYCEEVTEPTESNQSFCKIDDADLLEPVMSWKVFLGAQFTGIMISALFSLYDHYML